MSDQKPDQPTAADPSTEPKKHGGKLATKQMSVFDQIFIWTMVLLVGLLFGIGPSIGLAMHGGQARVAYQVDASEVQRRERIAQTLQDILNPAGDRRGPLFAYYVPEGSWSVARKSDTFFARDIRKAQFAAERGLAPSKTTVQKLVDDFMATKATQGTRTYAQMIADHRRAKDISDADLELWLSEEFACRALDVASTAVPAIPTTVATTLKEFSEEKVSIDAVVLTTKPLLPEITPEHADFNATYERLAALNRFTIPAASVVQVAAPDFDALLKAETPSNEQALIWYTSHLDEYQKSAAPITAPANGQTPPPLPPTEYRTFAEVKDKIFERLRHDAANEKAHAITNVFSDKVEADGLEQGDHAAFSRAAAEAGLIVNNDVQVPDSTDGTVSLPEYGPLKRTAREIGLVATRIGSITDPQQLVDGRWVVLRIKARTQAANKPKEDPVVRLAVIAEIAQRQAYPLLLKEAEELRAKAEKEGPGALRKMFTDPAFKSKWNAEVVTEDKSLVTTLEPPKVPEDGGAAAGEKRLLASLAVVGNPVALCEGSSDTESGLPTSVKLIQVTGFTAAVPPTSDERASMTDYFHGKLAEILAAQAEEVTRKKL